MPPPICPVEFALWWSQRYHRVKACSWSPKLDQVELFGAICQLRAQAWTDRLGESTASKWNLFAVLPSTGEPRRGELIRQEVIRDVLVFEPLVRLLASTGKSIRAVEIRQRVHPILHESFVSVRRVRCVALELLMSDLERGLVWARSINRLRITLEHWTDMLLGIASANQQSTVASAQAYGFRNERIREFAYEAWETQQKLSPMLEDWLLIQGVRRTMRSFGPHSPVFLEWESQLLHLATSFVSPKSFLESSLTSSLQIDDRFDAIEHWFSVLQSEPN